MDGVDGEGNDREILVAIEMNDLHAQGERSVNVEVFAITDAGTATPNQVVACGTQADANALFAAARKGLVPFDLLDRLIRES